MGMFDSIKIRVPLPLSPELEGLHIDWGEEVFQTKGFDNLLDLYEVTPEKRLKRLCRATAWVGGDDEEGGACGDHPEKWEDSNFHGTIRFYTCHLDNPKASWDHSLGADQMSWDEVVRAEGNDWWIEFEAVFDNGVLREIHPKDVHKTPVREILAASKEWAERQQRRDSRPFYKIVGKLRKFPTYRKFVRELSKLESKTHEFASGAIRKLG